MAKKSLPAQPKATSSTSRPSVTGATKTVKAPGQGPGPSLAGGSSEIRAAVPARILENRMVRRVSTHASGPVKPSNLVNYQKSLGAK